MKQHIGAGLMMAAAVVAAAPSAAHATRYVAHGAMVSAPAEVRVWVEGGDVFPGYGDVTLWVRPERDCYTSVFLVDTEGFIHVLDAGDGYDDGWLHGGRTYGYRACDLGLDRLDGRGIAYVFAVGSPAPFDYSGYGAAVRVGGFGFRIVGDPFVGCREFYMSLLPAGCRWDYVGVGFTRFYVREWVRYPSYLCRGHVRVGDFCRHCEPVYTSYRCNLAAPYQAMRPVVRYKDRDRYAVEARHVVRAAERGGRYEPIMEPRSAPERSTKTAYKSRENVRVVSTSREIAHSERSAQSRRATAPVVAQEKTKSTAKQVAYRSDRRKHTLPAPSAREEGARKKARQAE